MKGCFSYYQSPMGIMLLACKEGTLIGAWFEGQRFYGPPICKASEIIPPFKECTNEPMLIAAHDWLDEYFAGARPDCHQLSLVPQGTPFQQVVWQLLLDIPYGETTTYGALAQKVALKLGRTSMSSQAVGNAVGRNPLSIFIPCHRVVGSNGRLVGYAGGLERKVELLKVEGWSLQYHSPFSPDLLSKAKVTHEKPLL